MKKIFTLLLMLLGFTAVYAQTVITLGSGTTHVFTGCNFTVYDIGGAAGDYQANRDDTLTIYSNDPSNNSAQVEISLADFNIHESDTLFIYDGPSTADPVLAVLNDSLISGISSPTLVYAATIRNFTGAITIRLKTDGGTQGSGFIMESSCTAPCQRVNVMFDEALSNKVPILNDDDYYYLNVCPYDTIRLVAYGEYPDNNFNYTQTDGTSTFTWMLSGDTILNALGSANGNMIFTDTLFNEGRGYDMSLMITDSTGCASLIPQVFRVKTSSNPIRELAQLPDICAGQRLEMTNGYDMTSDVQLDTIGAVQETSLAVTDTIFLPDGQDCGNGCTYESPVTFTAFASTAKITSASDILYVRIQMEHSFVGDIFIKLTCPPDPVTGVRRYVPIMKKFNGGSSSCSGQIPSQDWGWVTSGSTGAYFGQPVDDTGGGCTPGPQGVCWNYCWSDATNQGYTYAGGMGRVYEAVNIHNNNIDSTNVANMTQVYHPDVGFSNLIGCPMNGTWSVEIMDGYSIDNGYICGWEMALDPNLVPSNWEYNVVIDSMYLTGPGADGPYMVPDSAGSLDYTIHVMDDMGCIYDTVTTINVLGKPNPDLGNDVSICYGDRITLDVDYEQPNTTYYWNTGDETESIDVISGGQYTVEVATTNDAGTLTCRGSDTINVNIYEFPKFDFGAPELSGCAPLVVRFENNSTPNDANFEWMILNEDGLMVYSSFLKSPIFEIEDPGKYSVYVKETTLDGCKDSVILWDYIVVNAQPIAEFVADPEISLMGETGGLVNFINYSDSIVMTAPGTSFFWDFGDGEMDSVTVKPEHTYGQWGDYDVTLHIETEAGCVGEIIHTVVIEQDLVFPNIITPNGDGSNDIFAIENLNTDINPEDPDEYRHNELLIFDRWGKKVYGAKNYDTFSRNGEIQPGSQIFDGSTLSDGVYYYSFRYKGKAKTVTYNGSLTIVR